MTKILNSCLKLNLKANDVFLENFDTLISVIYIYSVLSVYPIPFKSIPLFYVVVGLLCETSLILFPADHFVTKQ